MSRILGQFQDCFFPMFRSSLIVLFLYGSVLFMDAEAQSGTFSSETQSNFQPSVAVVIGILAIMIALTFVLLVYAKFCHRRISAHGNNHHLEGRRIGTSSRFSGIDKTVIEALPFFRFSTLKGSKEGLECSVCLSKFEDIEVLRLLPKCKHAFHIDCIDHWLEKHSSCPLCRHKVSSEDLTFIAYSNSMRILWDSQSERREDSNIELFVQREEDHRGSSRFSVGSSFRKMEKGVGIEEELLIQEEGGILNEEDDDKVLHKHKHKIVVSDFVFQNRWSNVSSSDLIFLNSEMLNTMSSSRFSSSARSNNEQLSPREATGNEEIMKIREEMEMKRLFENKVSSTMNKNSTSSAASALPTHASSSMNQGEKRSMSEITGLSRFGNWGIKNRTKEPSLLDSNVKEERTRRLWLPIARRTVQWFANREKRTEQPPQSSNV